MSAVSPARRRTVLAALRRGTVPESGLDLLAVGLDRLGPSLAAELDGCAAGSAAFTAVRDEYGAGKTFLARWLGERAKVRGMAVAEVQISETETPLHRLETVYRRLCERLATATAQPSAFRPVLDSWLYALEEDVLADGAVSADDADALGAAVDELLERRLGGLARTTPGYSAGLRGYRRAVAAQDVSTADAVAAWLAGQPHVAASARRAVGVKGDLDHFLALGFLQGLLTVLRDAGHPGLLLVLDEVETLQRVRSDARAKALNALRQLSTRWTSGGSPGCICWSPALRRSSTADRGCNCCHRWRSGCTPTSALTRGSTTPGPRRSGFSVSTTPGWWSWVSGFVICSPTAHPRLHESGPWWTIPTW